MWGHMWNWGGMVMMVIVTLLILALLIALIVAIVLLVRNAQRPGGISTTSARPGNAVEILKERYARGEINRKEYLEKRRELED
jgi:putative membrane protein